MGTWVEGPEVLNFDISTQSLTMILLITFDFKHFLT